MRKKKVFYNASTGMILQLTQIIYAFVFPKLVITRYGSGANGLMQSITQFLSYIALLDAGVSAVIRAKLYKPLAQKDSERIQAIVNSAKRFYRTICLIFILYLIVVSILMPYILKEEFDFRYVFTLVLIIGVATIAEYFWGISYQVLLDADQSKYIFYIIQTGGVVLNTLVSSLMVLSGKPIHLVKLTSTAIFIFRPIILSIYCNRHYKFNKKNQKIEDIPDKWAGVGHHLAYFLHSHTDIVILTIFKGALMVSVYSVYNMVVSGLVNIINLFTGGIEAAFGNMNAREEKKELKEGLKITELITFSISSIFFITALTTIIPFIEIYTKGVSDVNYIVPEAAIILIIAEFFYCIRLPYQSLVMATGNIKETMKGAFIEVIINIGISLIMVGKYGIAGVAFGTLLAMVYRTFDYIRFISLNVIGGKEKECIKRICIYLGVNMCILLMNSFMPAWNNGGYPAWLVYALERFILAMTFIALANYFFYKADTKRLIHMFRQLMVQLVWKRGKNH